MRAGSFVPVPALVAAPAAVLGLLLARLVMKSMAVLQRWLRTPSSFRDTCCRALRARRPRPWTR
jgi:hypothetical protein